MRSSIALTALTTAFLFGAAVPATAQMMGQPSGQAQVNQPGAQGWSYCPNCGTYLPQGPSGYGQGYGGGMGPGMMGYGMRPGVMGYGMGPGMMGYGMGPGMMGQGWGQWPGMMAPGTMPPGSVGPGMMGYGYNQGMMAYPPQPLEEKDVKAMVQYHLENFVRNPNLKLGTIKDTGEAFEVTIVTRDDSLVNRFLIDKRTGWMRPNN